MILRYMILAVPAVLCLAGCRPQNAERPAGPSSGGGETASATAPSRTSIATATSVVDSVAESPQIPSTALYRQRITTASGVVKAGTAFIADSPGSSGQRLFSAIHLLGPAGGLERPISPLEMPELVDEISISGLFDPSRTATFDAKPVPLLNAAPLGEKSKLGDVMAFLIPGNLGFEAFEFQNEVPTVGASVWLVAQVVAGAPVDQKLHRGTSLGLDEEGNFNMEFENSGLDLRATSGAPIIDSSGKVVAVNLAGIEVDGILYGVGNPASRFLLALKNASSALDDANGG